MRSAAGSSWLNSSCQFASSIHWAPVVWHMRLNSQSDAAGKKSVDGGLGPPTRRAALRDWGRALMAGSLLASSGFASGCTLSPGRARRTPDLVWGRRGLSDGRLMKPRAITIDAEDRIYVVDMTGRIQVFDRDGQFIRGWKTPAQANGRPTGLGIAQDGSLIVADTHYFRVLFYTPDGQLQDDRTIGGTFGEEPSQFHFVTDVAQDSQGRIFAGQYGTLDQIQQFTPGGSFVRRWGKQGSDLDCFARPQALLTDGESRLWVADACNHRLLVFALEPKQPQLIQTIASAGNQPGQLQYPYGMAFDRDGSVLVAEYGNHRVQRFARSGESLETWGEPGSEPGQFSSPWGLVVDSHGAVHVLDTLNHRVQRFA